MTWNKCKWCLKWNVMYQDGRAWAGEVCARCGKKN